MENYGNASNKKAQHDLKSLRNYAIRLTRHRAKTCEQTYNINKLNQYLNSTSSLINFIQKLFEFQSLKNFETIHLFIHQKGLTRSNHLEVLRDSHREYGHNISDFSTFFQSIKKSRNRSYGQSKISGFNLEILGTFLAHEFALSNYNLILIISRNDFLPQTISEIKNFKALTNILSSFIEIKLEENLRNERKEKISQAIHHSPFEKEEQQLKRRTKNLIDHGDIFHHERVSLLGELLNTLRHELSNPIFGLELTSELLLLEEHNEEQLIFLKGIQSSIKHSQNILESFTHLYKDNSEFEVLDIIKLIREVFTLTKSESRLIKKTIIYEEELLMVKTNSTWLAQVIFNLVINSSQALKTVQSPTLSITIKLQQNTILFIVQDNGPGISNDQSSEVFKPFYTTKKRGTGLGLSICHSLVKKLKGSITNIPSDKGALFHIKLPYENPCN